tara:strand:+ start:168 stop:1109 length:942 start_codon:yes stop_codon:yes gene_type:complete
MFTAYDFDGISKLSGLSTAAGSITVTVYKNAIEIGSHSSTVAEIGSSGIYSLNTSFSTTGYWTILIDIVDTDTSEIINELRIDVNVSAYNIDEVYAAAGGSGSGSGVGNETCIITVTDSGDGTTVIPAAAINVFNSAKTAFITFGNTDVNGQITFFLDAGTYKLVPYKPGYSFSEVSITVTDTSGLTNQSFAVTGATPNVVAPTAPGICRLFADFKNQDGSVIPNFKISVTTVYDASSALSISIAENRKVYTANSSGHLQFDVVQGITIEVSLISTEVTSTIVVPSTVVANLLDLIVVAEEDNVAPGLAIITI